MTTRHAAPTLDAALGAILDVLAAKLAERLDRGPDREEYSSRDLPPRTSRRRFAEICRSGVVADARRIGRDWVCSRRAWEASRARRAPTAVATTQPLDSSVDELLSRAGLRLVGGER
jgi:hypothetical protein